MNFNVYDKTLKRCVRDRRHFYVNGDGVLFCDSDPSGVDMSGKRRIFGADERFSVVPDSDKLFDCDVRHLDKIEETSALGEAWARMKHRFGIEVNNDPDLWGDTGV